MISLGHESSAAHRPAGSITRVLSQDIRSMPNLDLMLAEAKIRARRARRRAFVASVYPLAALDSARHRHARHAAAVMGADGGAPSTLPTGVFAAMPHWRTPAGAATSRASQAGDRTEILLDCITGLLELDVDRTVIAVLSNEPLETVRALSSRLTTGAGEVPIRTVANVAAFKGAQGEGYEVVVIGWRPGLVRRNGFYLTWAHKALFRAVLRDASFSHLIYTEDDIRVTRESLSYWCRFRAPLARHGLLPGFVRYETRDDVPYVVDQKRRQSVDRASRPSIALDQLESGHAPEVRFVSLENPYQGMYILDRELASRHLSSSPARSPLLSRTIRWPEDVQRYGGLIRERAAMGPILDDVPHGFGSRNVVPAVASGDRRYQLDPACLIEHLSGNYVLARSRYGKIPVEDVFLPADAGAALSETSPRQ
jgi:hypothetical protein